MNGCTRQWGVSSSELGAQYGGLLTRCKQQAGSDHAGLKSCVMQSCINVFEARGLTELAAGCKWFVDWFEVADNPSLVYEEIACPDQLKSGGINRTGSASGSCSI